MSKVRRLPHVWCQPTFNCMLTLQVLGGRAAAHGAGAVDSLDQLTRVALFALVPGAKSKKGALEVTLRCTRSV